MFFNWFAAVPVFHGFDQNRLSVYEDGCYRSYTRCRRLVHEFNTETDRESNPGKWIPLRYAEKFGKRCRLCWPGNPAGNTP